ncbi:MAG: ribosome silencing factor [Sandaracinaceae bacterium]|nr:ribosome silencing factor [Sandaracinaceae bacterium]
MGDGENGEARVEHAEDDPRRIAQLAAARETALAIAGSALDRKALNVVILDVIGKVDYTDYVVVMSGRSDRQVAAIAKNVEADVKEKTGVRCLSVEGLPQASWVLMDFGDVIAHVFHEDTRGYYDLESLWVDAARVPVDDGA